MPISLSKLLCSDTLILMWRTLLAYAAILALAAFLLEWIEYKYFIRELPAALFVIPIAIGFLALGLWVGRQLTPSPISGEFQPNEAAAKALGLTLREREVLALMAEGQSNKEIARSLNVSPNTIKTHVANLYAKLDVSKRTQAVRKAQTLALIP